MSFEIALVAGILGIIFLFAILSVKLDESLQGIKLFFMLLAFLFGVVGLAMISNIAQNNYSTAIADIVNIAYIGYLYIFIALSFIFTLIFVLKVLGMYKAKKVSEEGEL